MFISLFLPSLRNVSLVFSFFCNFCEQFFSAKNDVDSVLYVQKSSYHIWTDVYLSTSLLRYKLLLLHFVCLVFSTQLYFSVLLFSSTLPLPLCTFTLTVFAPAHGSKILVHIERKNVKSSSFSLFLFFGVVNGAMGEKNHSKAGFTWLDIILLFRV